MNRPNIYKKSVEILHDAYIRDYIGYFSCACGAAGNLIRANMGYKYEGDEKSHWWRDKNNSQVKNSWINTYMFDGTEIIFDKSNYVGLAKVQIDSTGYSLEELATIDTVFDQSPDDYEEIEDSIFSGLNAVIDCLKTIHEVEEEVIARDKEKFKKHYQGLKKPHPSEIENPFDEFATKLFPGGSFQMKKELEEVEKTLEGRYDKHEVLKAYVHAVSIYNVSYDKSINNVVTSILYSYPNFSKEDVRKIYNYVVNRPFSKVVQELKGVSDAKKLIMIAIGAIVELRNNYRPVPEKGKFEVILFNSLVILNKYQQTHPKVGNSFYDEFFPLVVQQATEYGIKLPTEKLIEFIENRMAFNANELDEQRNRGYLATKLYSNFYENPLALIPEDCEDVFEVVKFYVGFLAMMTWIVKQMKEVTTPEET